MNQLALFETDIDVPVPVGCGYPCLPPREPCEECRTYWAAIGRERVRIAAEKRTAGSRFAKAPQESPA